MKKMKNIFFLLWATRKRTFFLLFIFNTACMLNFHERLFLFSFCNLNFLMDSFISSKKMLYASFLSSLLSPAIFLTIISRIGNIQTKNEGNNEYQALKVCLGFHTFFFGRGEWRKMRNSFNFFLFIPCHCHALKQQQSVARKKKSMREAGENEKERNWIHKKEQQVV